MTTDKAEEFAYLLSIVAPDIPVPVREYRFDAKRKWRFDFAWLQPTGGVAVEVNGGRYAFAGGRHASDGDHEKLRRAAALGWRVLPVSPQALRDNPGSVMQDVREALAWKPA
jgi:very-short-patch-repair endonuclease